MIHIICLSYYTTTCWIYIYIYIYILLCHVHVSCIVQANFSYFVVWFVITITTTIIITTAPNIITTIIMTTITMKLSLLVILFRFSLIANVMVEEHRFGDMRKQFAGGHTGAVRDFKETIYGRFPKCHRVFSGRDPGTLKSDIVSKKHPQLICSDLRLSNWKFEDWNYGNRP